MTADNEFWLYSGNATGSSLTLQGEGHNWGTAFSFSFNVNPGDYLYVAAKDWGGPQSWQGAFTTPNGALYSNTASWTFIVAPNGDTGQAAVQSNIGAGGWANPVAQTAYNAWPWGAPVGNVNANWIWHDNLGLANGWNEQSSSDGTSGIFRSAQAVSAVPEPSSYAMMLGGLGLVALLRRRKNAISV